MPKTRRADFVTLSKNPDDEVQTITAVEAKWSQIKNSVKVRTYNPEVDATIERLKKKFSDLKVRT